MKAGETAGGWSKPDEASLGRDGERHARTQLDPNLAIAAAFRAAGLPVPEVPTSPPGATPHVAPGPIIEAALKAAGRRNVDEARLLLLLPRTLGNVLIHVNSGRLHYLAPARHFALDALGEFGRCVGDRDKAQRVEFLFHLRIGRQLDDGIVPFVDIGCGVPVGARMPVRVSPSRPGTPSSPLVGSSGSAATRSSARIAIPRRLPSLTARSPAAAP